MSAERFQAIEETLLLLSEARERAERAAREIREALERGTGSCSASTAGCRTRPTSTSLPPTASQQELDAA